MRQRRHKEIVHVHSGRVVEVADVDSVDRADGGEGIDATADWRECIERQGGLSGRRG